MNTVSGKTAVLFLGAILAAHAPVVLVLAADTGFQRDVLGGLAHRDVHVRQQSVFTRVPPFLGARRRLRRLADLPPMLLVALSGYSQDGDRLQAREAGIDHYLVKPVVSEILKDFLITSRPQEKVSRL